MKKLKKYAAPAVISVVGAAVVVWAYNNVPVVGKLLAKKAAA